VRANRLLIRTTRGWAAVDNIDGNPLIIEGLVGHGTQPSDQECERVGLARLATYATEQQQVTVGIEPAGLADTPMHAYRVGDTVQLEGAAQRVASISGARDVDGLISWIPQLGAAFKTEEEQRDIAIKKMSEGTMRGDLDEATPIDALSRKGNPADPANDPGLPMARVQYETAITASGTVNTWTDADLFVQSGGFSLDANNLLVCPRAGAYDIHAIVDASASGVSFAGYFMIRLRTFRASGTFYDFSFEMRAEWQNLPGGPTAWTNASMPLIVPEVGGKIGVTAANFNSGGADAECELGVHYIGPADFGIGLPG
jgi:hypothetical protein